jgi:hypothetical protein
MKKKENLTIVISKYELSGNEKKKLIEEKGLTR